MNVSGVSNLSPLKVSSSNLLNSPQRVATLDTSLIKPAKNIFLSVSTALQDKLKIDRLMAESITTRIFAEQKKLTGKQSITIKPSDVLPFEFKIKADFFVCLRARIGQGASTTVSAVTVFPTEPQTLDHHLLSPSRPVEAALKESRKRFSPKQTIIQNSILQGGKIHSPRTLRTGFDDSWATFHNEEEGLHYSLNALFDCDLTNCDFTQFNSPVSAILSALIPYARSVMTLHKSNYLHRDIKGANFLLKLQRDEGATIGGSANVDNDEADEVRGALTDFDLVRQECLRHRETVGTPSYLDPSLFGTLEDCLLNQMHRQGTQSKEGDVFSLGLTIFRDILLPFAKQFCEKELPTMLASVRQLEPQRINGPFTVDDLKVRGLSSNYRCCYCVGTTGNPFLIQYPDLTTIREKLCAIFSHEEGSFIQNERLALSQLNELSCRMQDVDLMKRPTIETVYDELKRIHNIAKASRRKRNLASNVGVEASSFTMDEAEIAEKKRRVKFIEKIVRPIVVPELPTQILTPTAEETIQEPIEQQNNNGAAERQAEQ